MPQAHAEPETKIRKNVMLPEEVISRGKALAKLDSRNFSTEMEALINQAYYKRFPEEAPSNKEAA